MSRDENNNNNNNCECELCHSINAEPVSIEKHGAKLLTVRIQVNNVCFGKTVAVACIIYDNAGRIITFRGFTTILCKEDECNQCGTIRRKLVFVLPDDIEEPEEVDVRIAANYLFPCE
ncbi:hypothetical protein KPL35_16230 [Clostridium sp. CF011]|uniref:hypothetical protein n=1 Tax=Clostridium sp. CF011 TaxID=2843318 RepID=UPI001C0D6A2F|nr:hypothetical protein [Clostridium sp. CF011]MBU3093605.1 hypothetical protein [Clostridium sp. CF011]WAG70769.1 hypothetical protein LL036_04880 [Clostridium sp. CF011]